MVIIIIIIIIKGTNNNNSKCDASHRHVTLSVIKYCWKYLNKAGEVSRTFNHRHTMTAVTPLGGSLRDASFYQRR
jgi:hypothetical protein